MLTEQMKACRVEADDVTSKKKRAMLSVALLKGEKIILDAVCVFCGLVDEVVIL